MQFLIGSDLEPVLSVNPGDSFQVETEDALAGRIRTPDREE
jgi:acetamidase/formamidase